MTADDWSGMPFLILWGVVAVFLGLMFATSPDLMESIYRRGLSKTSATKSLGERHAPRELVIRFYRIGGIIFAVLGVIGFVIGLVGTIGFATGAFR